jgi:hypothetical protein
LLLEIFGLIGFDYDLQVLDQSAGAPTNDLAQALQDIAGAFPMVLFTPRWFSSVYLKLDRRYQRAQAIVDKYLHRMIAQELEESSASRAERKRTSLIASLVASLQTDEAVEAMKGEEDQKGILFIKIGGVILFDVDHSCSRSHTSRSTQRDDTFSGGWF